MAKKKRRTELDIDSSIAAPPKPAPEPEAPPVAPRSEAPPVAPEPAPPRAGKKSKVNKLKLAIILSGGLGGLLLVGGITWAIAAFVTSKPEPPPTSAAKVMKKPKIALAPRAVANVPPMFEFQPFLVNLGKKERSRLMRVAISVQMSESKVTEEITRNIVLIRENLYFFLQSKTAVDFEDEKKRRRMAVEMAIILNRSIQSGAVTRVLFTGLTVL